MAEPLKLRNPVSSADLTESVKEYTLPSRREIDGISVPISPVVIVDPSSDPHRLVPQGWWLYQARRVNTQTNAGGGALSTRISLGAGQVAHLVSLFAKGTASAGAGLDILLLDEDTAESPGYIANIAAAANNIARLPSIGTAATSSSNIPNTVGMYIGPGQYLRVYSTAGLLNEILTVGIVLLLSTPVEPTFDTTGSAGTPVLAASTISEANTLQKVDLPW